MNVTMAKHWYVDPYLFGAREQGEEACSSARYADRQGGAVRRDPRSHRGESSRCKDGKRVTVEAQVLPGLRPGGDGAEQTRRWHVVQQHAGVTGFVGGAGRRCRSSDDEVDARSSADRGRGGQAEAAEIPFESGEHVRSRRRSVQRLHRRRRRGDRDKGRSRSMVSVFGRATPVELDFTQG